MAAANDEGKEFDLRWELNFASDLLYELNSLKNKLRRPSHISKINGLKSGIGAELTKIEYVSDESIETKIASVKSLICQIYKVKQVAINCLDEP